MSRKMMILLVWLAIGAIAAGQRGYYGNVTASCSVGATIAATIITGPVNPQITCNWPSPAAS
jgi:hypothetical protein